MKRIRKKGDKVWYIPGYRAQDLIIVRCSIIDVEDQSFYWLDEPLGHSVTEDDIYDKLEHAESELRFRYVQACMEAKKKDPPSEDGGDLKLFRAIGQAFIIKTHEANGGKHPGFGPEMCPFKEKGKDWFNVATLNSKFTNISKKTKKTTKEPPIHHTFNIRKSQF